MKFRNVILFTTLVILMTSIPESGFSSARKVVFDKKSAVPPASADVQRLISRLEEIKGMDFKRMSRHEKDELRKETRAIKKKLHEIGGTVYISAAGLLIIVLLLLILL